MPARRCDESKIRNGRLRAFLRYSAWERELRLHSVALVGYPREGGVVLQPEEEVR
jgi:hypothetical protein